MRVFVNAEEREVPDGATVLDVLTDFGAPASGVAVARHGEVLPRATWAATSVSEGDSLEVLTAVQGG